MGKSGEPVSAEALTSHFHKVKHDFDKAVELGKGHLTQFEVYLHPIVLVFIDFVLMSLGCFFGIQGFHCSSIQLICRRESSVCSH